MAERESIYKPEPAFYRADSGVSFWKIAACREIRLRDRFPAGFAPVELKAAKTPEIARSKENTMRSKTNLKAGYPPGPTQQ